MFRVKEFQGHVSCSHSLETTNIPEIFNPEKAESF